MPTPGDVGVRKPLRRVTSVGVLDGGLGKTPTSLLKIISEADHPIREVTHLAVWSGMPRERTPACARSLAGPI